MTPAKTNLTDFCRFPSGDFLRIAPRTPQSKIDSNTGGSMFKDINPIRRVYVCVCV